MSVLSDLAGWRAARAVRRRLEQELATYDTPSAMLEIEQVFARHDGEEARELEAVLHGLAVRRRARAAA